MLNLIINTRFLDQILLALCFFNIIIISVTIFKEKNTNNKKDDRLIDVRFWTQSIQKFWCVVISILCVLTLHKLSHNYFIVAIITVFLIRLFVKTIHTDIFNSTLENKFSCVFCSFIIINFFIYDNYSIYLNSFQQLSHSLKEALLIIFIVFKMIAYIYFILLNISILFSFFKVSKLLIILSNLISLLTDNTPKIISFLGNIEGKLSSAVFSFKNVLLYFLFFPLFFISMFIINLLLKIVFNLISGVILIINVADKYTKNSKFFVWVIVKISLIISLVFAYLTIISSPLFSERIISAYNYLSTVILIPILLNSLNKITKKKIRN